MYEVVFSEKFDKELKRIAKRNPRIKTKVKQQIELLSANPRHKSLRIHKLSSQKTWSLSVTMNLRIIFVIKENRILCLRIGKHEDVY